MKKITIGICLLSCMCCLSSVNAMKIENHLQTYANKNGLVGMNRDVVLRLADLMPQNNKVRTIIGLCYETYKWKTHPYFIESRAGIGKLHAEIDKTMELIRRKDICNKSQEEAEEMLEEHIDIIPTLNQTIQVASRHRTKSENYLKDLRTLRTFGELLNTAAAKSKKIDMTKIKRIHIPKVLQNIDLTFTMYMTGLFLVRMKRHMEKIGIFRANKPDHSDGQEVIDRP